MNEQNMAVKTGFGIDVQKLLRSFLKKWWLIVLAAAVFGTGSWFYTSKFITPLYKTAASVYVNSVNAGQGQQINSISSSMLATSQRLVLTYASMVSSDAVLDRVTVILGEEFADADLRKIVKAEQVDETEMLRIVVTHPDAEKAANIANVVADVTLEEGKRVVEGSSAKVVDYAKTPKAPVSPNVIENTIVGVMLGGCLAAAYVTLRFLLDVHIREESDLYALFNLPVLGQIPSFESEAKDKAKERKKKGGKGE